jgi:DHA1 family multidrug resistance protein-like MFS transporter
MLPFLPLFIQELGTTKAAEVRFWTGFLNALTSLCLAVMAPVWGIIADRYGRKLMILRAMLVGSVVVALMSLARSVWTVLALRIRQGLFTGTITAASALVAAGAPQKRLSFALGFLSSSTFIGMSFGPLIGGLSAEFIGYRHTFLVGAVFLLAGFFLVLFFIQEIPNSLAERDPQKKWSSIGIRSFLMPPLLMLFGDIPGHPLRISVFQHFPVFNVCGLSFLETANSPGIRIVT